jgi:hypothetical protein
MFIFKVIIRKAWVMPRKVRCEWCQISILWQDAIRLFNHVYEDANFGIYKN